MKYLPIMRFTLLSVLTSLVFGLPARAADGPDHPYNVLFIISDDLTATALSCYGNEVCKKPAVCHSLAELFDMRKDPKQYTNLAADPNHAELVSRFKAKMAAKMTALRANDL